MISNIIETPSRLSPPQGGTPTSGLLMISLKPAKGSISVLCLRHDKGLYVVMFRYIEFYPLYSMDYRSVKHFFN
jgi:hypothetical protein